MSRWTTTVAALGMSLLAIPALAQNVVFEPTSKNYEQATAHEPHFDDRGIWPEWVKQTEFVQVKWPEARVLVWKHVGTTTRGADVSDPANWLENGEPAKTGPDENTDIIITSGPDGAKTFLAGKASLHCRHFTVGSNVGAFLKTVSPHGNVWIKKGGSFHQMHPNGDSHVFWRSDNEPANNVANKITLNRSPETTIEWVGNWKIGDELDLFSGTFIIAPGSTFMPGDRSTQHIYPDAKLVLTSGSAFYKRDNQYWGHDMEIEGQLWAGTPKRPLTEDATLGLSFKAKGNAKGHAKQGDFVSHLTNEGDRGLILYRPGRIVVHSDEPSKARLVFTWRGFGENRPSKAEEPAVVAAMPHGIDMVLIGQVDFKGVEFRHVLEGGIVMPDPAARSAWKNVTFGEGNFAKDDALFSRYEGSIDAEMNDDGVAKGLAVAADKAAAAQARENTSDEE